MNPLKVFDVGSNTGFASELARLIDLRALPVEKKVFPNEEIYVRLTEDVSGEDVLLAGTTYPNPNEKILEIMLAIDAARRAGAKKITAAIGYMAYGRQDRVQRQGEAVSASVVINAFLSAGLDELFIADYHNPDLLKAFPMKAHNVRVARAIGEYARKTYDLVDPVVVLPGSKALEDKYLLRAKEAAEGAGAKHYTTYIKERDPVTGLVTTKKRELGVTGKDVLVVDDEISSGSTVINAVKMLKEEGPSRIIVGCTHGIFADGSLEKIRSLGVNDIISSDSIPSPTSKVHLAPLFKEAMVNTGITLSGGA